MPLSNARNSENHAVNTPLSEQKPAKFEKSRLGNAISANIDFGYHFRYGSPTDEHLVTPKDMGVLCEITEKVVKDLKRPLNFIHMPVPQLRTDDACFAPLRELSLDAGTDLYLGLLAEDDTNGDIT